MRNLFCGTNSVLVQPDRNSVVHKPRFFSRVLPKVSSLLLAFGLAGCMSELEVPKQTPVVQAAPEGTTKFYGGADVYTLKLPGERYFRIRYLGQGKTDSKLARFAVGFGEGSDMDFEKLGRKGQLYEFTVPVGKSRTIGGGPIKIELSVAGFSEPGDPVNVGHDSREVINVTKVTQPSVYLSVKGPFALEFIEPGTECGTFKPIYTLNQGDRIFRDVHDEGIFNSLGSEIKLVGNTFTSTIDVSARTEDEARCKKESRGDGAIDRVFGKVTKIDKRGVIYSYTDCAYREGETGEGPLVPAVNKTRIVGPQDTFELSIEVVDPLTGESTVVSGGFKFCSSNGQATIVRSCSQAMPDLDRFVDGLLMDALASCIKPVGQTGNPLPVPKEAPK